MLVAAAFEVAGDALIRRGMTGSGIPLVVFGFVVLGTYGVLVNLVGLDFSRLLGAYVGWFAFLSILCGRFIFREPVSIRTWVGATIILVGSLVIQLGRQKGSVDLAAGADTVVHQ